MNPDDDLEEPQGYIECNGSLMPFWLPEGVDPDDLGLEWIPS
jgi:hypothetical protein